MRLSEIIQFLENIAPAAFQESYDSSGLIVGETSMEINKALICLDSTPEVIEEALEKGANLVIAHHPIVFSGLKKFNGKTHIERAVMLAIKHNIAIYAIHTNLDNVLSNGVNEKIGNKLGLENMRILSPKKGLLQKLVTNCPDAHAEEVRQALFTAGAGKIGNYDTCSFNTQGQGSFRATEGANPFIGEIGKTHWEQETRIETVFPRHIASKVISALKQAHPYEEVAYETFFIENEWPQVGSGIVGELPEVLSQEEFLNRLKTKMQIPMVRYTQAPQAKIKTVALCGGSGSFLLGAAMASGAEVFLTSDFKYHQFFESEGKIMIADVGHYEGEYFTIELLHNLLTEKFRTFAVVFSGITTNPIKYYC